MAHQIVTAAPETSPLSKFYRWLDRLSVGTTALIVFFFVLMTHMQFPIHQTIGDPIWNLPTAFSLLNERNLNLSEYQGLIDQYPGQAYTINKVNGKPYNLYPPGASLIALPFAALAESASRVLGSVDLYKLSKQTILVDLDMFIACFTVAAACALIYLTARINLPNHLALLPAILIAFCTTALSIASRALWQHGPSMMLLAAALYALLRARQSPSRFLFLAGFCLAFAYITRPTNSLSALILSLYVLITYREKIVLFLLGALVVALPFFYTSYVVYGVLFPPYFFSVFVTGFTTQTWVQGMLGTLISPARGLFIFSPVLLLSLVGLGLKLRHRSSVRLEVCIGLIILLHWLVISAFHIWGGGFTFGPRYMTDMLPYFAFLFIPFPGWLQTARGRRFQAAMGFLVASTLVSLFIHVRGASSVETQQWNGWPISVDAYPARIWDWGDLQFMRGLVTPVSMGFGPLSSYRVKFDAVSLGLEGAGWAAPETNPDGTTFQWMNAKEASLRLPLTDTQPLDVQIGLSAITPDLATSFRFDVNGHAIALVAHGETYTGIIPTAALAARPIATLRFSVNYVVSPRLISQANDDRQLGLKLDFIQIQPRETPDS